MLAYYVLFLAFALYRLSKAIYNLYFHPLAKFPGPKLAAASHLYEFYWSVIRDGEFIWVLERLHKKYGPIVRITPRELHISDPSFYNEIYAGNPKRVEGDYRFTRSLGTTNSMFAAVDHDLHQARRNSLANFFSKRSISDLQPIIQDKAERFIMRLEEASQSGSLANLSTLFIPLRFTEAKKLPPSLVGRILPKAAVVVLKTHRTIRSLALEVLNAKEPKASDENMFAALADPSLPAEERTLERLEDEGFVILAAGTETTAYSLSVTMFYLLDNPGIFSELYDEIKGVMPDPAECPPLATLENLALLRGVVNEGLRLSMGTLTRHPRIAPDRVLQYKDWSIPAGHGHS
ncbi:hypothetical protein INS49_012279 [Diaporthe citri]|uniref:uncharacterized protein n=1 Tax=Diaporthe citri TaxID=83186 RepID=UPI001C7F35B4|nr:uncharacterized protein INS49_012279 [Diaporthe citri]KAG6358760.1 hypothetical protein INS49_012279 [Diaporthe citri]